MKKIFSFLLFAFLMFLFTDKVAAQVLPDGTYNIQSALSEDKMVDLFAGDTTNNTNIQLFTANGKNSQKWVIRHIDNDYYVISSYNDNNKVMDVHGSGKTNGTNVELFQYNGGNNQQWLLKDAGDGYFYVISKCSGLYLDIQGASTENETNIFTWSGNGGDNQKFKFIQLDKPASILKDGYYTIESALDNDKVLSSSSEIVENGLSVVLNSNQNKNSQKWYVDYLDNGYYKITTALDNNMSLDVQGSGKTNGTKVELFKDNGGTNQQWYLKDAGDGYFYIISKCNNMPLDVQGASSKNGSNIIMWSLNSGDNQKFKFTKTEIKYAELEEGYYTIESALDNDKVLSSVDAVAENGTNVVLNTNQNKNGQKWYVTNLGKGYYKIVTALDNNMSLDVQGSGKTNGTKVELFKDHGGPNQQWFLKDSGDGYYYIISECNDLALDVQGASSKNGSNIIMWSLNGGDNQKFKFTKTDTEYINLEEGYYTIESALNNNKVISAESDKVQNETNVVLKTNVNRNEQRWYVTNLGEGYYKIVSALDKNLSLDVFGGNAEAGSNVQLFNYHGSNSQQWLLQDAGDGYFYIISRGTNYYVDVYGSKLTEDTNIQLWNSSEKANQKFKFVPVDINEEGNQQLIKDGYYTIESALDSSKALDVFAGVKENGTKVQMYTSKQALWQTWYFKYLDNGYYSITSAMNPEIALDVYNSNTIDGTKVQIYKYSGLNNQQWLLKDAGDGYFYIISKDSGFNLEAAGSNNGDNIQIGQETQSNNQKFKLTEFTDQKVYTGIDVSYYQKNIDWQKVSDSGIGFVIIRAGFGGDWTHQDDEKLEEYVAACEKYNIPYGLYLYSYASEIDNSDTSAQAEARHMLRLLDNLWKYHYEPNLGTKVFIDMEDSSVVSAGKDKLTAVSDTFCTIIESRGYTCGVYANRNWLTNNLDAEKLAQKYEIWLAEYLPVISPTFDYAKTQTPIYDLTPYKYWQFASDGQINGINGNVDLDLGYDIFD